MKVRTIAAATGVALLATAPAHAESGRLADFSARLTTTSPASPTGFVLHVVLRKAGDPNAKPSPLRSASFSGPAGLRFDTGVAPQCMASDAEIQARGSDACPPETQLTVGQFSAITGFGPPVDPFNADDHVFNGPDQFIEVITPQGASATPGFDRLTIAGSTLTAHPPKAAGGPPDGETSIRSIDFTLPVRTTGARALITAPAACPASGHWTSSATFQFADGDKDTVASVTPCASGTAAAPAATPALRVVVRPRHVRAGVRTRFRIRVRSTAARCAAGARVRFGGRVVRTDPRGRASVTATMRRTGVRRARVTRAGCRPAIGRIRVLPAAHIRHRVGASELSTATAPGS